MGQGPGSSLRELLSSFVRTKAPIQVKDGNFRLNLSTWTPDWSEPEDWGLRFLEHHPVTSPPMNQKKVTHPAALTPNLLLNTLPWNTLESSVFWAWVAHYPWLALVINFPLLQTDVSVCLASLCVRYTNFGSTTVGSTGNNLDFQLVSEVGGRENNLMELSL